MTSHNAKNEACSRSKKSVPWRLNQQNKRLFVSLQSCWRLKVKQKSKAEKTPHNYQRWLWFWMKNLLNTFWTSVYLQVSLAMQISWKRNNLYFSLLATSFPRPLSHREETLAQGLSRVSQTKKILCRGSFFKKFCTVYFLTMSKWGWCSPQCHQLLSAVAIGILISNQNK